MNINLLCGRDEQKAGEAVLVTHGETDGAGYSWRTRSR